MAKYGCNSFAGKRLNSNSSVQWSYHLMVLPCVIMVFLFNTRTWPGILAAFEDFIPAKGWWDSKWIGLKNFRIFFSQPDAWNIVRNTLVIAVGKIVQPVVQSLKAFDRGLLHQKVLFCIRNHETGIIVPGHKGMSGSQHCQLHNVSSESL